MRKISFPPPMYFRRKTIAILSILALVIVGLVANESIAKAKPSGVKMGSTIKKHTPIEVSFRNANFHNKVIVLFLKKGPSSVKLGIQRLSVDGKAHFCAPQVIKPNSTLDVRINNKSILSQRVTLSHWPQENETCSLYFAGLAAGSSGLSSVQGPAGPRGVQGIQGIQGVQGVQGVQGIQGVQGETGATGPAGPQGGPGAPGEVGAIGPAGPQGDPGARGAKGLPGADGADGMDGADGADGLDGVDGADGIAGIDGAPGPQGPRGDKGATGATGATGPVGAPGPQGIKGDVGPTGPKGNTGVKGADGVDGADGADGIPGDSFELLGEACSLTIDDEALDGTYVAARIGSTTLYTLACDTSLPQ